MDAAGVLTGALTTLVSLVAGLSMGYRMGRGREPWSFPALRPGRDEEGPIEEEARWAARGYTDEDAAP